MQRVGHVALIGLEIVILSALILAARCANYQDVFVGGDIYFTDADCYARMTRVRMCAQHPGLILRHHEFENFPQGTTPHTTAPLDYLILALSIVLRPFTPQATDLAGALISPLFALLGGWFLWWWSKRMKLRYRWALLILYAISPILVHATELGRPDHQSLLVVLVTIALCAEWTRQIEASSEWSIVSGIAWGLAIWVSAYEPLILLFLLLACHAVASRRRVITLLQDRHRLLANHRCTGWIWFATTIAFALLIERRLPSLSTLHANMIFKNWSRTIGELLPVSPLNPIWFSWAGYLVLLAPILMWLMYRKRIRPPLFIVVLLIATCALTIWQARWAYFFMSIFAIALPSLLEPIKSGGAVWIAFTLSIFPILRDWDAKLWPNEIMLEKRVEQRREGIELRELAHELMSPETRPFLAPWWLSPSLAYWSGQPGVAGSSHESLDGIADSARFFLTEDPQKAREVLENRRVAWVFAYDSDRVASNSAAVLGRAIPPHPLCRSLDRTPTQAPKFLALVSQNGTGKLFRVANNR